MWGVLGGKGDDRGFFLTDLEQQHVTPTTHVEIILAHTVPWSSSAARAQSYLSADNACMCHHHKIGVKGGQMVKKGEPQGISLARV